MDFQTLHYLYVTISFHLEICFWGQTHPTISDDVTNYTLFLFWRLPLIVFRFPKEYDIRGNRGAGACNKDFDKSKQWSHGVFSAGCACPKNVTLGYELMLKCEGSHNLFRLLTTRDLDTTKLRCICYDFACGFRTYLENREPSE